MKIKKFECLSDWDVAKDCALSTIGKEYIGNTINDSWKVKMLKAEHSPIKALIFKWTWVDLPYWVSVHLTRHKVGIEHFVSTQRSDCTGEERESKRQDAPVMHTCIANAQAIINISRKRLCLKASKETRQAWRLVIHALCANGFYCMRDVCVRECRYRNNCPELKTCGYWEAKNV